MPKNVHALSKFKVRECTVCMYFCGMVDETKQWHFTFLCGKSEVQAKENSLKMKRIRDYVCVVCSFPNPSCSGSRDSTPFFVQKRLELVLS